MTPLILVATMAISLSGAHDVDGMHTEADKTCVLATAQADSRDNGIYTVRAKRWTRGCDHVTDMGPPIKLSPSHSGEGKQ